MPAELNVGQLLARAMTRLNKMQEHGVAQQRLLNEARDYVGEALDLLQAEELVTEDERTDACHAG